MAEKFLDKAGQALVVQAIKEAELNTSGEIRVHIESVCKGDPYIRAVEVFNRLKMYKTAARNGVLIYLAVSSHKVAIIGDSGINELVPEGFWDEAYSFMAGRFREGDFVGGIVGAIGLIGNSLKEFFPYTEDDVNEQSDEISFGK